MKGHLPDPRGERKREKKGEDAEGELAKVWLYRVDGCTGKQRRNQSNTERKRHTMKRHGGREGAPLDGVSGFV